MPALHVSSPAKLRQNIKVFLYNYKKNQPFFVDVPFIVQNTFNKSTSGSVHFGTRDKQLSFSESNEPFFDRLDIFSDATDLKNTLVLLFSRHLHPLIDSGRGRTSTKRTGFFLWLYKNPVSAWRGSSCASSRFCSGQGGLIFCRTISISDLYINPCWLQGNLCLGLISAEQTA